MADSAFGDLGGPGKQSAGASIPDPEGGHDPFMPSAGSVFGDLGGGGVACQLDGGEVPALPVGTDPGGQGGR